MARVGILFFLCLLLPCLASKTFEELTLNIVYDALSGRMDTIMKEINKIRTEHVETKAAVNNIERRMKNFQENMSATITDVENNVERMCQSLINDTIQEVEELSESLINDEIKNMQDHSESLNNEMKRQSLAVQDMLFAEKKLLREIVQRFEDKFTTFQTDMKSQMTLINASVERSVDNLKYSMIQHKEEMNINLQNVLNETDVTDIEVRGINARLNNTERRLSSMSSSVTSLKMKQESHKDNFDSQISRLSSRILEEEATTVAFSAKLDTKHSYHRKDEIIIFDNVRYSYGGGYSSSTGIFTAPKSGTYLFTFNVQTLYKKKAHVGLVVRGNWKTFAIVEGDGINLTGGNAGIEYLSKGDKAWIQTGSLDDKYYIWPYRTTFNGILID